MNKIHIDYVDHFGDDLRVANVARVSFDNWKEEFDERDAKLIDYLARHEHTSPFRHTAVSVRCYAPVFLARQLQKHVVGLSWNEVSRRYVDTGVEFYVPDSWRSRPVDGIKQGSGDGDLSDSVVYDRLTSKDAYSLLIDHATSLYEGMIEVGVAPEMARMVLPQSMVVSWVWTGSLQAFYHVWRLRSGEGAQVEAKEFAKLLDDVISPLFPHSWSALKNA